MRAQRIPLLWKWSLRDIREHWMQVVGISIIIALGVALSSGLGSSVPWRVKSFERSYAMLRMFDVKLELTQGSYLEAERLAQAVRSVPHADWIEDVALRLVLPSSVDASTAQEYLLVSGEIIGVEVGSGGPAVNKLHMTSGRGLEASDAGEPVCVIEHNFAASHDLEVGAQEVRVIGGHTLKAVGNGISAEHFMVVEEESGVLGAMAQDRFAALFVPLETAQEIVGMSGVVNEALLTVREGVEEGELDQLKIELKETMEQVFPEVGVSLEKRSENRSYRVLQDDITSDRELYDGMSTLLSLAAAFGAFILIGRIVDAQRREIGINMALGVTPWRIARRYLLIGVQIALLGMVLGAVFSVLINRPLADEMNKLMPLPYTDASFQKDLFIESALVAMVIPFLAVLYPVWRAVRVAPVDAIQTGYLVAKGGGLAPLLARVPLPGSSITLFPVRNLSRGLRRTVMTVLGLSMAVTIMISFIGMIDTLTGTLDVGSRETKKDVPDRMLVTFDDFYLLEGAPISEIEGDNRIGAAVPSVVLPGELAGDEAFEVIIQLMDLENQLWTPTIIRGSTRSEGPGVLITEKAARDLGVEVGDRLRLHHPYRESRHAWRVTETAVEVMGIHPDILRMAVYMDIKDAAIMNLDGVVNGLQVNPGSGVDVQELQQAIIRTEGVASVRQVAATLDAIKDFIDEYVGVFRVIQFIVLLMAFLVAFNTTRSNVEERRRDLATMFAFGTRVRTAIRMAMMENLITGLLGTVLGIGLGWLLLGTMLLGMFERDAPELNTILSVSGGTYAWAVMIGVIVVALTPLFLTRRLLKMDVPSTLRVLE